MEYLVADTRKYFNKGFIKVLQFQGQSKFKLQQTQISKTIH